MKSIIKSAKTIDEAVEAGIKELGITRDQAEYTVMQEPSKGIFGIFGGTDAVVKVLEKEKVTVDLDDIFSDDFRTKTQVEEEIETSVEVDDEDSIEFEDRFARFNDDEDEEDIDSKEKEVYVEEEVYLQDINEDEEDFDVNSEEEAYFEDDSQDTEELDDDDYEDMYEDGYAPDLDELEKKEESTSLDENQDDLRHEERHQTKNHEEDFDQDDDSYPGFSSDEASLVNTRELEFSGQAPLVTDEDSIETVAQKTKNILEDILVKMHIDAKVSYETAKDNIINLDLTDISENDTGIVIGAKGETLNAIQYVLSLLVNGNTNKYYRITLNVGNYRDRRKKAIEANAQKVAYKVLKTKKSIALKPMNSYERRIVHYSLQSYKQLETVSSGKFPNRKVVIKYKGL